MVYFHFVLVIGSIYSTNIDKASSIEFKDIWKFLTKEPTSHTKYLEQSKEML